jgi:L-ascorbate metabolism protein UlaG (beta-lactamase superfamily)
MNNRNDSPGTSLAKVYLRQNAFVEPLYNQWYAWPYLVSPMTAPMYVANLHVRLMESFVSNPRAHVAALRNPEMAEGPFLAFDESRVPEVERLLRETRRRAAALLEFADAVRELTGILDARGDGGSLQPLYAEVPDALKGYVELVYDVNNRPGIRLLEPLLYRSRFYDENAQSLHLSVLDRDDRPFVFSTPRLEDGRRLSLALPYRAEELDLLFAMRDTPRPLGLAREALGLGRDADERFASLFTDRPPRRRDPIGEGIRVRYFGHACVLVESRGTTVLTDPIVPYDHGGGLPRFGFADLPEKIDYALVTHAHPDHCVLETLLQLRHKIRHVVVPRNNGGGLADPSLAMLLERCGFPSVWEIDELGTIQTGDGSITSIPFLGEHGDLNIRSKTTYLVRLNQASLLFCADSNAFEPRLYDHLADVVGDLDAAFIGMECDGAPMSWLYGPLVTAPLARRMDQSRRLDASDCERALGLVRRLRPRSVYVYAMGSEPWLTYLTSIPYADESRPIVESRALVRECRAMGVCAEALHGKRELRLA